MQKCVVCSKRSINTNANREGVIYHELPKDEYMKTEWFKVLGMIVVMYKQCKCCDHFLEENFKPGKSYSPTFRSKCFATQSNDVETGNNVILPMDPNIIREKHTENAVVNKFKSRRRSSRLRY